MTAWTTCTQCGLQYAPDESGVDAVGCCPLCRALWDAYQHPIQECAACGVDFPCESPDAGLLCPDCAVVQPCGHLYADTVEDAAGQPFCARCLEESRDHADHH